MPPKLLHPISRGELKLINNKLLVVAFIAILLYSALNVAPAMAQCSTCRGTGRVTCPYCDGTGERAADERETCWTCLGSGTLKPTITLTNKLTWPSNGKVYVRVEYRNEENVTTYGRVTAKVTVEPTTYTATSPDTMLPPQEETEITFAIEGISSIDYIKLQQRFSTEITLDVDDVVCPYCDGTGVGSGTAECPQCGGTGFVNCPTCSSSAVDGGGLNIPWDIGGAAVGVAVVAGVAIAAFALVKKRKVSEKDLRKLTSTEFQNWVLKKLAGKPSALRDSRLGIDGYTIEGQPVSIKQSDGIGRNVIDSFAAAMGQSRAKNGIIVAFSFGDDAFRGKVRAKLNYGLEIQMLTVKDLIEGRNRTL